MLPTAGGLGGSSLLFEDAPSEISGLPRDPIIAMW